jgi:chloride channel 7
VGAIVEVLRNTHHHAFPVVDDDIEISGKPVLLGLVLRSHLLVLLKKKQFLGPEYSYSKENPSTIPAAEFAKPGSGKGLTVEGIELSAEEEEMLLDIHEVSNTSPYTVVETMSLSKAYTLFRQLGLRHLCVVPRTSEGGDCRDNP